MFLDSFFKLELFPVISGLLFVDGVLPLLFPPDPVLSSKGDVLDSEGTDQGQVTQEPPEADVVSVDFVLV